MASAGQLVLEVRSLSATFDDWPLFTGVDLDLHAGECVVLTDESDLPRTAFLECVTGGRQPASGAVRAASSYAVWQDEGFPPDRPIGDVIDEWLAAAGVETGAAALLEEVGLGHRAGHEGWAMSAGERRRAALAVAFRVAAPLLVIDEPERGLDATALSWVCEQIRRHCQSGGAVLLATHHPSIAALADSVLEAFPGAAAP